jgi:hypothetical protein
MALEKIEPICAGPSWDLAMREFGQKFWFLIVDEMLIAFWVFNFNAAISSSRPDLWICENKIKK